MTAILGISAFYHDSAAAIVVDGEIIAAAQEERFTRIKHDASFPTQAIRFCLRQAGISIEELDYVGFYEKPVTKFERLLETYVAFAPAGYRSFRRAIPRWLKQKLHVSRELSRGLEGRYSGRYVFTDHHESHAASAFFPSPFDKAAILTIDGVGEWSTACWGVGEGNHIELNEEIRFPHSLGLLYSAFTHYLGFRVNSGEYKVMGLAPYGRPVYRDDILNHLMDVKEDGSFQMDMSYFNYCHGLTMTSKRFHELFDGAPRTPESEITQREMDLAASVQAVTEEIMLRMSRYVHRETGMSHLVLAGGVALNCVGNGRILREGPFDQVWVQPAAGDSGGALGVALFLWHQLLQKPRHSTGEDFQRGSLLGPQFGRDQIQDALDECGATYSIYESEEELCEAIADLLAREHVVGWFQGKMEFGPRALGARSILGDARSERMPEVLNRKIKFRESFRPFAPIVLKEHAQRYFEMRPTDESPYMSLVAPVREQIHQDAANGGSQAESVENLRESTPEIPAVTHVDRSARVQTVDEHRHPLLHKLLAEFYRQTGCPVLINTSFNVRGEPIVCTPSEAYQCFMMTDMDTLVIDNFVLHKSRQSQRAADDERRQHLSQFVAD